MTFLLILCGLLAFQVQMADPDFDARVAQPAYTKSHPKVLFDEAHSNFHTATGRYKPFADLISNDGYQMTPNQKPFEKSTLEGYDILAIANARGGTTRETVMSPAFTEPECDVVRDWVRGGGSLLLIADHAPFGAAASILASRFGVDMRSAYTSDPAYHDKESGNATFLVFSRENGLLGKHPITEGRNPAEKINFVLTFTGQSLKGPEGSTDILKLSDKAFDVPPATPAQMQEAIA